MIVERELMMQSESAIVFSNFIITILFSKCLDIYAVKGSETFEGTAKYALIAHCTRYCAY